MKKGNLLVGLVSVCMLTSCFNGLKEVKFSEFVEEAKKVESHEYDQVTIIGKVNDESINVKVDDNYKSSDASDNTKLAILCSIYVVGFECILENTDAKYYTGNGFRMKTGKTETSWDKYGYVTMIKGEKDDSKVSLYYFWK